MFDNVTHIGQGKEIKTKTLSDGLTCHLMEYGINNYALQMKDKGVVIEQMPVPMEAEVAVRLFDEQK